MANNVIIKVKENGYNPYGSVGPYEIYLDGKIVGKITGNQTFLAENGVHTIQCIRCYSYNGTKADLGIYQFEVNNYDIVFTLTVNHGAQKNETYHMFSKGDYTTPNFRMASEATSATIPDGTKSIDDRAFAHWGKLKSITIPNGVTSIGEYAFYGCWNLTSIVIPDSVTSIGDCAFYNCRSLTSITIPNSVTSIGKSTFHGCSGLKSITIPNNVKTISNFTFEGCCDLTNITIPDSVTSIGEYAFFRCCSLTSVTIPNSVKTIGYSAFRNCTSLTDIEVPDSVKRIGKYAFYRCDNLKKKPRVRRGCYVATCVYGSYDCPEVWTLRRYRDKRLGASWYGRLFIRLYYAVSPTLVKWFGHTKWFKKLFKKRLDKMVQRLQNEGYESTPYEDKAW